jgi:hypothetical protein
LVVITVNTAKQEKGYRVPLQIVKRMLVEQFLAINLQGRIAKPSVGQCFEGIGLLFATPDVPQFSSWKQSREFTTDPLKHFATIVGKDNEVLQEEVGRDARRFDYIKKPVESRRFDADNANELVLCLDLSLER